MKDGWLFRYGVPPALIIYALLVFGAGEARQVPGATLIISALTYMAIVFLFAGIPTLVYHRQTLLLSAGVLAAVAMSAFWLEGAMFWILWVTSWTMLLGSTLAVGILARDRSFGTSFTAGLTVVLALSLAQFLPLYEATTELARNGVDGIIGNARMQMTVAGYRPEQIDEFAGAFKTVLNAMIRLMPCWYVLGAAVQFTLGYVWFSQRELAPNAKASRMPAFVEWKAPFWLAVAVIIAAAMRIFGGESLDLIADNALVALGAIYAIMGMALIESFLRRVRVGVVGRLFVYVALFLAQIVGLLVIALLGLIDSHVDWRTRAQRSVDETI
jgi:hypothetical protein